MHRPEKASESIGRKRHQQEFEPLYVSPHLLASGTIAQKHPKAKSHSADLEFFPFIPLKAIGRMNE
jgi:hypothetical protein